MTRPIERYARASVDIPGGGIEAGIQYDREPEAYRRALKALIEAAAKLAWVVAWQRSGAPMLDADHADAITAEIERKMATWIGGESPARGWFVEVWRRRPDAAPDEPDACECLTQVYAPCGMPIDR